MRQRLWLFLVLVLGAMVVVSSQPFSLPNKAGSLKFAVLGNSGTAARAQYQLAEQMAALHGRFKYDFVILVGGNIYGPQRPQDFLNKFELPYKPLLDAGVRFYAALGTDDSREQRYYKLFNMDGKLYYTFRPAPDVQFFALETTYLDPQQIQWLEQQLQTSNSTWKIAFFHHPLYSSASSGDSAPRLRSALEPLFVKYNVSVALTGQHRFYERMKPQQGVDHFVVGSGGQLQSGQLDKNSAMTAKGFDADQAFLAVEIVGDEMFFQAISREGQTIDSGVIQRRARGAASLRTVCC